MSRRLHRQRMPSTHAAAEPVRRLVLRTKSSALFRAQAPMTRDSAIMARPPWSEAPSMPRPTALTTGGSASHHLRPRRRSTKSVLLAQANGHRRLAGTVGSGHDEQDGVHGTFEPAA